MSNEFQNLRKLINEFRNSEIPAERLFYLKCMKKLIAVGEELNRLILDAETQKRIEELKEEIRDYKLYPKLKTVSE